MFRRNAVSKQEEQAQPKQEKQVVPEQQQEKPKVEEKPQPQPEQPKQEEIKGRSYDKQSYDRNTKQYNRPEPNNYQRYNNQQRTNNYQPRPYGQHQGYDNRQSSNRFNQYSRQLNQFNYVKFSREETQKIKDLWHQRPDDYEFIAQQINSTPEQVFKQWAQWTSQPEWSHQEENELADMKNNRVPLADICRHFNYRSKLGIKAKLDFLARKGRIEPFEANQIIYRPGLKCPDDSNNQIPQQYQSQQFQYQKQQQQPRRNGDNPMQRKNIDLIQQITNDCKNENYANVLSNIEQLQKLNQKQSESTQQTNDQEQKQSEQPQQSEQTQEQPQEQQPQENKQE